MKQTNRSQVLFIVGGLFFVLIVGYFLFISSSKLTKVTDELAMRPPYESYEPITLLPNLKGIPGKIKKSQFSKKGKFSCEITYKLTGSYPIVIKRTTKFVKTGEVIVDYFIIKPLREEHAQAVYEVASASKDFLKVWQPHVAEYFSQSPMKVRNIIRSYKTNTLKQGLSVGLFYKKHKKAPEQFIGLVKTQSLGSFKDRATDVSYWLGAPEVIDVKGAGAICAQAFFENVHYNYPKKIKSFVFVIHKDNLASIAVAKKLGARRVEDDERTWGGYAEDRGDCVTYIVDAKQWNEKMQ